MDVKKAKTGYRNRKCFTFRALISDLIFLNIA